MKVLLVYPPIFRVVRLASTPLPIGMLQVARWLVNEGHQAEAMNLEIGGEIRTSSIARMRRAYADTDLPASLADPQAPWRRELRGKLESFRPDILAFSCATEQMDAAARLAEDARQILPDIRIEFGGSHVEPNDWVRRVSREALMLDPALELLAGQNPVSSFGAVLTSLGCPFDCIFCGSPKRYGRKLVNYPIEKVRSRVLAAVEAGAPYIHLMDDTVTIQKQRAIELADMMAETGLPWRTQTRVDDLCRNPQLAAYFRDAGCSQLTFGVESGSPDVLRAIRKRITREQVLRAVDILNEAGVPYTANFMIGFPNETDDDVEQTLDLLDKMQPSRVLAGSVVPYPHTELHDAFPEFSRAARRWPFCQWSPFDPRFLRDEDGQRIQGPSANAMNRFFKYIECINNHAPTPGTFSTVS